MVRRPRVTAKTLSWAAPHPSDRISLPVLVQRHKVFGCNELRGSGIMRSIHRHRWACSLSWCALFWIGAGASDEFGTAHAQSAHSDEPAPPGRSYLTGDWGGYRSYLEDNGVTITLAYINDFLANVGGGIRP